MASSINVDELLDDVAAEVGLDDFGHPSFREGLEQLISSADSSAKLSPIGQQVLVGTCRSSLENRLRVTAWHRDHPALRDSAVDVPIIIVGLSRSGTTALSHLLGADPANRSLLGWEASRSVPPPTTATYRSDTRLLEAQSAKRALDLLNPEFRTIHEDLPTEPVECAVPLAQHFTSLSLSTMFNITQYDDWLLAGDRTESYNWHRQVLQVLQSQCPGPWQLKSPLHLHCMEEVAAAYPNALFVMPHRDPVTCVISTCSLAESLTGTFTDADHRDAIAVRWPETLGVMLDRVVAFRRKHGDGRFIDLPYESFVSDPLAAVAAIYERIGRPLSNETERLLQAHIDARPQNAHGRHAYSLEEFGLKREGIEERLSSYFDYFGTFGSAPS